MAPNDFIHFALPVAFTLLVACALTSLASMLALILFKLRRLNQAMQHPYLAALPWEKHTLGVRAAILLDYFLRIAFPRKTFWITAEANRLLAHVTPEDIPGNLKWPLYGLWVGCFVGLFAMVVLWGLILAGGKL